ARARAPTRPRRQGSDRGPVNLYDLRAEVLAHGFDQTQFTGRINQYLNDALRALARRIDFYAGEAQQAILTVAGVSSYAWPDDFGRGRHLRDVDEGGLLRMVALRELDATSHSTGRPLFYAHNGAAVQLAPVPDDQYSLAYRYWSLPPLLAADLDVPAIPDDYHSALVYFALQRC